MKRDVPWSHSLILLCGSASPREPLTSYGERAAAAAGALGHWVLDAEAPAVEVVVEVYRRPIHVEQALAIHNHGHAELLHQLILLRIVVGIEIELVLEATATAAAHG